MIFIAIGCYLVVVPEDRVPLYVRLPREQAAALDRLVDATGRRKQQLVSELLADQLAADAAADKDRLAVGRIEIIEDATTGDAVLTLAEAAELLRLPAETLRERAVAGNLPGRSFGDEWRFSRAALLAWLAAGERKDAER